MLSSNDAYFFQDLRDRAGFGVWEKSGEQIFLVGSYGADVHVFLNFFKQIDAKQVPHCGFETIL